MGLDNNIVEFDIDNMKITRNAKVKDFVLHIEKVNDETFLTGESYGYLELINKKELICLSLLQLKGFE